MARFQDLLCDDDERRAELRKRNGLYGIDFVEVRTAPDADNQRVLELHFMDKKNETLDALLDALKGHPERFVLTGGVRVRNIAVTGATRNGDVIELRVSTPGDFSNYRLRVDHPAMDPVFAEIAFNFKAGCSSKFDCRPSAACEPGVPTEPVIDYTARDYASFRQALLDRVALTNPDWRERNPADLGIAVLELFAYAADRLSYYQDAVANEAFLETASQRVSVRRHARLIDYRMHDGQSARAFVQFHVGATGVVPKGTQVLTQLPPPLGGEGAMIFGANAAAAVAAASAVFEVAEDVRVDPALTGVPIYAWGRRECCLPAGATTADLEGDRPFQPGDLLVLEEVKGIETGKEADADRTHRQAVRLTAVSHLVDPLTGAAVTRVAWDSADALTRPFCLSSVLPGKGSGQTLVTGVTVAHGNVALARHGKRFAVEVADATRGFQLEEGPVSHWPPAAGVAPVAELLASDPRRAAAAVAIQNWTRVDTLLDSHPNDPYFVAEIDNAGRAQVRFGDGAAGQVAPAGPLAVEYCVGLGPAGNVAADALRHVVRPAGAAAFPDVQKVRNPLPAWGGTAAEPLAQVKLTAPASLRDGLFRAVTEEDYAAAAELMPEVSRAVATFRWTGTWHTVFLSVDPVGGDLSPDLRQRVRAWVGRYLQAGYDLKVIDPVYVPLEIEIRVCTAPNHFPSDVYQALLRELGVGTLPGGRLAFFHPDRFTFGQPLFLSQLSAAVTAVPGVRAARVAKLQRFGKAPTGELEDGVVRVGRTEVIRCDSDPNFVERGLVSLLMEGA